ncbi:MAG TPA: CDP-diacylglycerol--serine O-phosphatidyltransferase [Nitrospirales bacterium]|nr:CDP-diacylglycerol--serine O-phosphatidyltransferase [Nitrospirales bacterium]
MKQPKKRRVVYLIPNLLTTGNLFSGLASILFVFGGDYGAAAIAILVAIVFDVLDGTSARLMKSTSDFGLQYDSLADVVAFGVAPGLLMYSWALSSPKMLGAAVMFAFVACGALRLARHNVLATTGGDGKPFTGLPIPGAAGVMATLVIFDHHVAPLGEKVKPILGIVLTLVLAFLMVSTVRYRSLKELKTQEHYLFNFLVYTVLALITVIAALQFVHPAAIIFAVFAIYALSGVVEQGWKFFAGLGRTEAESQEKPSQMPME